MIAALENFVACILIIIFAFILEIGWSQGVSIETKEYFADGGWLPYNDDVEAVESFHPCESQWTYENESGKYEINTPCVSLESFVPYGIDPERIDRLNRDPLLLNKRTKSKFWCSTTLSYSPNEAIIRKQWGYCLEQYVAYADGGLISEPTKCRAKWRYKAEDKSVTMVTEPCISIEKLKPYGFLDSDIQVNSPSMPETNVSSWCSTTATHNPVNSENREEWGFCALKQVESPLNETSAPTAGQNPTANPAPSPMMQEYYADGGGVMNPTKCAKSWVYKFENKSKTNAPDTCIPFTVLKPYGYDNGDLLNEPVFNATTKQTWCSIIPQYNPFNEFNRTKWGYCATLPTSNPTSVPTINPTSSPSISPIIVPTPAPSPHPSVVDSKTPSQAPNRVTQSPVSNSRAPTILDDDKIEEFKRTIENDFGISDFDQDQDSIELNQDLQSLGALDARWSATGSVMIITLDRRCNQQIKAQVISSFANKYPDYAFDVSCGIDTRRRLLVASTSEEVSVKMCSQEPCELSQTQSFEESSTSNTTLIAVTAVVSAAAVVVLLTAIFVYRRRQNELKELKKKNRSLMPILDYKVSANKDGINVELPHGIIPKEPKAATNDAISQNGVGHVTTIASFQPGRQLQEESKTKEVSSSARVIKKVDEPSKRVAKPKPSRLLSTMQMDSAEKPKYVKRSCASCRSVYYSASGKTILCLNCRAKSKRSSEGTSAQVPSQSNRELAEVKSVGHYIPPVTRK